MRRFLILCGLAMTLALATPAAKAGFVPTFVSSSFGAGVTTFTYNLNFTSNGTAETLTLGNFVTFYDVFNPLTTTFSATNPQGVVSVSTAATGVNPPGSVTNPTDNPALNNVTFTYTDGTVSVDTPFVVTFSLSGNFVGNTRTGQYTSVNAIGLGLNNQIGAVTLPVAVPEPTSLALSVLGLSGVLGMIARRHLRSAHS